MAEALIQVLKNGPLLVKGRVDLKDAEGKAVETKSETIALCRCGHSVNKPFCDGAHQKANFQA